MNAAYSVSRRNSTALPYPNAASRRYFWDRLMDKLLCAAICVGILAILFFLLTMA